MFRQTIRRVLPLAPRGLLIVTNAAQAADARKELEGLQIPVTGDPGDLVPGGALLLAEPRGRNTAPAIALAAALILQFDSEALMTVLPSDHYIPDEEEFRRALLAAEEAALLGSLVTLGITPHRPATGYGYIRKGNRPVGEGFAVEEFREKPDRDTARSYLESGNYLWNSGMFVWRADVVWRELETHMPGLAERMKSLGNVTGGSALGSELEKVYDVLDSESIDYGLMEKSRHVAVIPGRFTWSDVGSWNSLWELEEKDRHGNVGGAGLVAIESAGNLVRSEKTAALVGVKDMIVVETADAILVCRRDRAQLVREVLDSLRKMGREDLL